MITGGASLLGVLGWPVKHSLSPRLHNHWLRQAGIDAAYLPLAVQPDNLAAILHAMPRMGFIGANATIPHKEKLCELVQELDPIAQRIGAVNTLIARPDGSWRGTNTDAFGFIASLRAAQYNPAAGTALVLGAGGAARAVLAGLLEAQCPKILLTNRSPERATALAEQFGPLITTVPWQAIPDYLPATQLLVNTTACGLNGENDLTLRLDAMPTAAAICDLVYRPLHTGLLREALRCHHTAIDGLGMLLYQAQESFRHWFGVSPSVDDALRRFVLDQPA